MPFALELFPTLLLDLGHGDQLLDPFVAGGELTLADCAAAVHLPLVSLSTKLAYGRDFLEEMPQVKPYLKMLGERPAFAKVAADRKAAQEAMAARAKK